MDTSKLLTLSPYFAALLISLSIATYAWRRRRVAGALPFAWVAFSRALWTLGFILELTNTTIASKLSWDKLQWLAGILGLLAFYAMVIEFTGIKIRRRVLVWTLLLAVPMAFLLLLATDNLHHLIYPADLRLVPGGLDTILVYELTPTVFFIGIYSIATLLVFIGILVTFFFRPQQLYRQQIGTITIGSMLPILGWILILLGVQVTDQRDITPFTFALGNLVIGLGLFRYRLFDISPIARDKLFEEMADPVIVLDNHDRIVDINQAGLQAINRTAGQVIGQSGETVYSAYPELTQKFRNAQRVRTEFTARVNGDRNYFELSITPIYNRRKALIGRIFVTHDVTRRKDLENSLRQLTDELEQRVNRRTEELAEAYDTTLEGWARALEFRDKETEGHSRRVTQITLRLARELGISDEQLIHIHRGALLHDIGKMAIPDDILRKAGSLTEAEREIVRQHPETAYSLLKQIPFLQKALEIPYCHHEKWDGSGYPRGLKEEQIPLAARIFAIADVWDALSYDRPYNKAWSPEQITRYLHDESGRHFDPKIATLFLELVKQGEI
jgi:putative nucleotidyltransferase with HDIG domain/PAS domain S-box-containing protein